MTGLSLAPARKKQSAPDILRRAEHFLKTRGVEDALASSEQLLGHVLGKTRSALYVYFDETLSPEKTAAFFGLVEKRANRYPVQYLVGSIPFRCANLDMKQGVFIPRPETECLVDVVLERLREKNCKTPRILDIGTGSGCLAISLALEIPDATIVATDRSIRALRLAERNAVRNGTRKRISFVRTNYWNGISGQFDFMISNPPYLSGQDLLNLQPEIQFEPKRALDGGADGLRAYDYMARRARAVLKKSGTVAFEVGSTQAESVSGLLKQNSFHDIRITKDLSGIDRIVSAIVN